MGRAATKRRCRECRKTKSATCFQKYAQRCIACDRAVLKAATCPICGRFPGLRSGTRCKPRAVCHDPACQLALAQRLGRVGGLHCPTAGRVVTEWRCPACATNKPLDYDHWAPAARDADGNVVAWDSYCRPCRVAYTNDRRRSNPEIRERERLQAREAYRRKYSNPEAVEARRAYDRAYHANVHSKPRQREALGAPPDPHGPELPALPLATFIDGLAAVETRDFGGGMPHSGNQSQFETVCERLGVSPRSVYAWRRGERAAVRASTVDRVAVNADVLWWEIYDPALYPEAQVAFGDE